MESMGGLFAINAFCVVHCLLSTLLLFFTGHRESVDQSGSLDVGGRTVSMNETFAINLSGN